MSTLVHARSSPSYRKIVAVLWTIGSTTGNSRPTSCWHITCSLLSLSIALPVTISTSRARIVYQMDKWRSPCLHTNCRRRRRIVRSSRALPPFRSLAATRTIRASFRRRFCQNSFSVSHAVPHAQAGRSRCCARSSLMRSNATSNNFLVRGTAASAWRKKQKPGRSRTTRAGRLPSSFLRRPGYGAGVCTAWPATRA